MIFDFDALFTAGAIGDKMAGLCCRIILFYVHIATYWLPVLTKRSAASGTAAPMEMLMHDDRGSGGRPDGAPEVVTMANTGEIHVMLADGVSVGQRVAINLPDEVGDGGRVQPVSEG